MGIVPTDTTPAAIREIHGDEARITSVEVKVPPSFLNLLCFAAETRRAYADTMDGLQAAERQAGLQARAAMEGFFRTGTSSLLDRGLHQVLLGTYPEPGLRDPELFALRPDVDWLLPYEVRLAFGDHIVDVGMTLPVFADREQSAHDPGLLCSAIGVDVGELERLSTAPLQLFGDEQLEAMMQATEHVVERADNVAAWAELFGEAKLAMLYLSRNPLGEWTCWVAETEPPDRTMRGFMKRMGIADPAAILDEVGTTTKEPPFVERTIPEPC